MTSYLFTQYQIKAEPPSAFIQDVPKYESAWHYPWSEPVRQKIAPALAIALMASGPTSMPPMPPAVSFSYYNPLSEPVRVKPGLRTALQQFDSLQVPVQPLVSSFIGWFNNLSEPVRVKPRLQAGLNPFFFYEPEFPEAMDMPWYNWLSEPVRLPRGLKAYLQQTTAYHPRILPTPNVTMRMAATEINTDVFLGAINVYDSATPSTSGQGAKVSIVEVPGSGGDPVSIRES